MRTAQVRLSTVTLDMADALELSELLDYLAQWLGVAGEPVRVDLENFAWDEGAMPMVGERLASFARLLVFGHAPSENDDDLDNDGNQDQPW